MTSSPAPPPSTEARQHIYLKQLRDHQLALKQLLDQQPEAGKTLADLLHGKIQPSFPGHPLPIELDMVSVEEDITLDTGTGAQTFVPTNASPRALSTLFTEKPWGGDNLEAPNRLYRFYAKATHTVPDATAVKKVRTVNSTIGSSLAFAAFIDELIRRPDHCFQQQLDSFWASPFAPDEPLTRRQWLADRQAKSLLAEAALRVEDGTLDEPFKTLIDLIVSHPASQARSHLPDNQRPAAFALSIKGRNHKPDIPLIGVFMLSSKTPDADISTTTDIGAVALFTPDRGIDAFASLQALDQSLCTQMASDKARERLLANALWQDQARARRYLKTSPTFGYTPIHEHLFKNRVAALLALQKKDIEYGWRQLPRHEADGKQVHELFNRLAHIGSFLDMSDVLIERSRRYIETTLPSWYQGASTEDKRVLEQLAGAELEANKRLATQFRAAAIPSLREFSRNELARQLEDDYPGWSIDPDKVQVKITTSLNPASLGGGIGPDHVSNSDDPTIRPASTVYLTLTELALKNNKPWDLGFYKLFTGEQTSMAASGKAASGKLIQFDEAYLRSLIQKLDVSAGYDELLQLRLIKQGLALRKAWGTAYRANLKTQLLAASLDTGSFLKDRENRGYQWVESIIESYSLDSYKTVGGHKIVASALLIANSPETRNGYVLDDALVISAEKGQSLPNVILFTPSSPTGQDIKEFADSTTMHQFLQLQWDTSVEWRQYVMQRLSVPGQALMKSAESLIQNPFDNIYILTIDPPLDDALYEQRVQTLRSNADHASTSNAEVEHASFWNKLTFGLYLALDLISFLPITSAFNAVRSVTRTVLLLKQMGASKYAARALWSLIGTRARPISLRKIGAVPAFRPTPDLSGVEVTINPRSLDRLRGNLFQSKTSPQQYALINGKHYLTDVAQGQRFIHPQGTASRSLRYPLVLDDTLKNWQAEALPRLPGGMDVVEKGPLQTTYLDYELPLSDITALPALNRLPSGAMNLGFLNPMFTMNTPSVGALHIFGIQARLRRHARSFFSTFVTPPRRIALPERGLQPKELLQHLFIQRDGLVFGEKHTLSLTRQFLIKNMAEMKSVGVKAFYFELFNTDLHQVHLDMFNVSPTHPMPQILKERLQVIDQWAFQSDPYSYTRLIEDAHAQGIRIMALDTTASSVYAPGDLTPYRRVPALPDQMDRVTMFNFFAYKKITFDQLTRGAHRWVALVGQGHCNTVQNIPGLAELTNAIGVRLERRLATQPVARISQDPGVMIGSPSGTDQFIHKCDLLVCLPSPINQHDIAARVHNPNLFTTVSTDGHSGLKYMNAQRQHVDVRVFADGTQAYVNHEPFGALNNRRLRDLDALTDALIDELGMIEV